MTAPLSWTPPTPDAAPPLVARPDRGKARSWLTFILLANGVLAVICLGAGFWASSTSIGALGGLSFGITLAGAVFQMVFHAFFYGRLLGTPTIAEIGPQGIRGLTTRWVPQDLPWSSVVSVTKSWNSIVVTPVDGAGPKILIPTRATDTETATVRAAIAHFSGGRL